MQLKIIYQQFILNDQLICKLERNVRFVAKTGIFSEKEEEGDYSMKGIYAAILTISDVIHCLRNIKYSF